MKQLKETSCFGTAPFSILALLLLMTLSCSWCDAAEYNCANPDATIKKPFIDGNKSFMGGIVSEYQGAGGVDDVYSPIIDASTPDKHKHVIGQLAQMTTDDSLKALEHAKKAWNRGQGVWPLMSSEERIVAMQNVVSKLKERREEIIDVLQWEICKSSLDAAAEFDRTMGFIEGTINEVRLASKQSSIWRTISGIAA